MTNNETNEIDIKTKRLLSDLSNRLIIKMSNFLQKSLIFI